MHEPGRVEKRIRSARAHPRVGDAVQIVVEERKEPVERIPLAPLRGADQDRDLPHGHPPGRICSGIYSYRRDEFACHEP